MLDDPLSALDLEVASKLLKTINTSQLLKDKTFVFSTNNPSYLAHADRVIYLRDGFIKFNGDYEAFQQSNEFMVYQNAIKEDIELESEVSNQNHQKTNKRPKFLNKLLLPSIVFEIQFRAR